MIAKEYKVRAYYKRTEQSRCAEKRLFVTSGGQTRLRRCVTAALLSRELTWLVKAKKGRNCFKELTPTQTWWRPQLTDSYSLTAAQFYAIVVYIFFF